MLGRQVYKEAQRETLVARDTMRMQKDRKRERRERDGERKYARAEACKSQIFNNQIEKIADLYITLGERYRENWEKCKCRRREAAIAEGKKSLMTRRFGGAP